jgi:hypothetical protein
VVRRQGDVAIDPYYSMDNGLVGLRCFLRGTVVVGQATGAVHITFARDARRPDHHHRPGDDGARDERDHVGGGPAADAPHARAFDIGEDPLPAFSWRRRGARAGSATCQ